MSLKSLFRSKDIEGFRIPAQGPRDTRKVVVETLLDAFTRRKEPTLTLNVRDMTAQCSATEPDLVIQRGENQFAVVIKVGNPELLLPSGTGVHMANQIEDIRRESGGDVRGLLITNYGMADAISGEMQNRGIDVIQLGEDKESITSAISNVMAKFGT